MKYLIGLTLTLISFSSSAFSTNANEPKLQITPPSGWIYTVIPSNPLIDSFTGGAEASLTYGPSADGPLITVLIYKVPLNKDVTLGADTSIWHKFIFANKATAGVSFTHEKTYSVGTQPRYYVEYQTDSVSVLNTSLLAIVIDGEVHVLVYESPRINYVKLVSTVREMYRSVKPTLLNN